jgi:hypothetical protein
VIFPVAKPPPAVELPRFRAWIRLQRCVVPGCAAVYIQACHFRNRRMYGDVANLFPCCGDHHVAGGDAQHRRGIWTFQHQHGVDLGRKCAEYWHLYTEGEAFLLPETADKAPKSPDSDP